MKYFLSILYLLFILSCTPSPAPTQTGSVLPLKEIFIPYKNTSFSPDNSEGITDPVLVNVKTTDRISSNHYSDMVVDSQGNSYIACFVKKEDEQDYVLILKLSLSGAILWESGNSLRGRATAITIDQQDNIWVLGVLSEGLPLLPGFKLENREACLFIAQFDPTGECLRLITNKGQGKGFNIHINKYDEILISGLMGGELSFGNVSLKNDAGKDIQFLAQFDQQGQCLWIKPFDASVSRIRSDSEGHFYLCGSFSDTLTYGTDSLFTKDRFDDDGFLMKLRRNDHGYWIHQFGQKGLIQAGYATREAASDFIIDPKDQIFLCAMMHLYTDDLPPKEKVGYIDLAIRHYDSSGLLVGQTVLARHLASRSNPCMTQDSNGQIWISGNARALSTINDQPLKTDQEQQTFLLKLTPDKQISQIILPEHRTNMIFRSAYAQGDRVFWSGHFQTLLSIYDQKITNDGKHGLFFFNKSMH